MKYKKFLIKIKIIERKERKKKIKIIKRKQIKKKK